jgi:spermidine synthase
VGVSRLIFLIGAVLIFSAAIGLVFNKNKKDISIAAASLIFIASMLVLYAPAEVANPERGLLVVEQSPYAEIRVLDMENKRHLLIDGGVHTIVDPESYETHYPYAAVMDMTQDFFEKPGKLLLVGLGGGTIVKNFAREGWQVDAVEIDPVVSKIARQYFGLQASEGRLFHMDGRQFLMNYNEKYDIIIMDAFGSSSIPFHLVTRESFGLIASRLNPKGIFAINLESHGWESLIVRSLAATLKHHFSEALALPAHGQTEGLGNMVIFAANRKLELQLEKPRWKIPPREYLQSLAYRKEFAWKNRFEPDIRYAPVLTDDLNPVDLWSEETNLIARKTLHSYFRETRMSW